MVLWQKRWPGAEAPSQDALLGPVLDFVAGHLGGKRLSAVGRRIVHGGTSFVVSALLDTDAMAKLDALCLLGPLHQPHNVAAVRTIAAMRPGLPQVGCFDTAFHAGQDATVTRLALPRTLAEGTGLRRYGFHGLSYEYITERLGELDRTAAAGPTAQRP
jgi:acetate kinase